VTQLRAKDPCHCGSGKRYKHCHMPQERTKSMNAFWLFIGPAFVVLIIGIALWAKQSNETAVPAAGGGRGAPTVAGGSMRASANQDPLPGGRAAEDWEFDETNDRHWNPDHGHWHEGPPPPPEMRVQETSSETNPNVASPEPWQYDPASNQYYDPGHEHWHSGPPPPPAQRTTVSTQARPATGNPNIPNPEPWQYDALSNRHFNPNHGHWHNGPPPANRDSS
jgi:hypothetical protein